MHIRFKFRSAVDFDAVDIGDRPSISVMELKSKIITLKKLDLCHDFDLVFSHPLTGLEYKDETYQIPSNSSVIIKRVPAESPPAAPTYDLIVKSGMKKSNLFREKSGDLEYFNDFGIDSCVVQDEILPHSNIESKRKNNCDNKKENVAGSRSVLQKCQAGLVGAMTKGFDQHCTKGKFPPEKLEPKTQEHVKLEKRPIDLYDLAEQNASLPSELRCSICSKVLREAVMIPCCQHSFCERCIRGVLSEKANCPRCSSHKFTEEDLLPNISLRQAIKHFLESQDQFSISENALRRYAPDEESGIQGKDLSSAVTIVQKRPKKLSGGEGNRYAQHVCSQSETGNKPGLDDFQGENNPVPLPQIHVQERGEDGNVSATARYRKADRTCYMCDAPNHFIRDCPFAYSLHPMPQTVGGMATHATPYWDNTAFGPMMPYTTMYGNTGMMPFNASLYPVSPVEVYPYMSYMYGQIPAFCGNPRMAGMAPLTGNRSENPSTDAKFFETRNVEIRGKHSYEYMMRRQTCDGEDEDIQTSHHNLPKSSQSHAVRENSGSYSGKKHIHKSRGPDLHGEHYLDVHSRHDPHGKNSRSITGTRDRRAYQDERSNSEVEYMSNNSERYDGERQSHNHYYVTRNHHERRDHYGSDSSWSRHYRENKKRVLSNDKGFIKKHGSQFGPRVEPSSYRDEKKWCKGGDHRLGSKYSNHHRDGAEYIRDELFCRSKMVRRDDDCREDYYQPKRKRVQ